MAQDYNPISGFTNAKSLMEEAQMVQTLGDGATSGASTSTGSAGLNNAGAALGQIAPLITPEQEDVLETDNFIGKYAQGKALEFGAKGMKYGGPVGGFIGATAGLGYGLIKGQDIQFDALNNEQYQMGNDAKKEANKQELQMKNTKYDTTSVPSTKYGVVKKLGAITGTVANNMSVAQYNSAIKMSGIAKNMDEPIMAKGVVEDWEEGLGKARFGSDYDPKKADIA